MASKRQLAERKATVTNFQFHPKRTYEEPEPSPEMSPQEMQVAEKHYRDACIWIGNLHSAIREADSNPQANSRLDSQTIPNQTRADLTHELLRLFSRLGGT